MEKNKIQTTQERNITDGVLNRIKVLEKEGEINFPSNYSYQNALKSAHLILSEQTVKKGNVNIQVLEACTKASVINALLDMTIQGLSPIKKQCYFIPMGDKLTLMKSYMGNIASVKRLKGVKEVFANVIYSGDEFEYKLNLKTGCKEIIKHEQKFENIDTTKIKGAYAIVVRENGPDYVEVMNISQIKNSWNQGNAKGQSLAHKNFSDEMAKKTVINRACKNFLNTSDDSDLLIAAINRTKDYDPEDIIEVTKKEVDKEIMEEANKEVIDVEIEESIDSDIIEEVQAEVVHDDMECDF